MAYHQGIAQYNAGFAGFGCGQGCGCRSCRSNSPAEFGQTYEQDQNLGYYGYGYAPWGGYAAPPAAPVACDKPPARQPITPDFKADKHDMLCPDPVSGIANPGQVIREAVRFAVQMLDHTIGILDSARTNVCSGLAHGLNQTTIHWLRSRLSVCIDDPRVWTAGTFVNGSVAEVIRRLTRVRNLIANDEILYVCNPAPCNPGETACDDDTPAFTCINEGCADPQASVVRLCPLFWTSQDPDLQAQTIIHEASHLYHCTKDFRGMTVGIAYCLTQFVAVTNGRPPCLFADRCAVSTACVPAEPPNPDCTALAGFGGFGAAPRLRKLVRVPTRIHPDWLAKYRGRQPLR